MFSTDLDAPEHRLCSDTMDRLKRERDQAMDLAKRSSHEAQRELADVKACAVAGRAEALEEVAQWCDEAAAVREGQAEKCEAEGDEATASFCSNTGEAYRVVASMVRQGRAEPLQQK